MSIFLDPIKNKIIDLQIDCCPYDKWVEDGEVQFSCSLHSEGFLVFIREPLLTIVDEYKDTDPYGMKEDLEKPFQLSRIKGTIELIRKHNKFECPKILDVGCGQGHITKVIRDTFPDAEVFGIDHSISAIRYANTNYNKINFLVGDVFYPPFVNSFFDIIICNNIWEHITDPVTLAKVLKRILKNDGILLISTPSRYRLANLVRALKGRKISLLNKYHITEYSVGQVIEILGFAGFTVKEVASGHIGERTLRGRILKKVVKLFLRMFKSENILDLTAFYIAVKT